MAVTLQFQGKPSKTPIVAAGREVLTLDACTSQSHGRESTVTDHPVEDGADISDHIRPEAKRLSITGVVSATPIKGALEVLAEALSAALTGGRTTKAFDRLEKAMADRELVTVETSLMVYKDMAITSVTMPREVETGGDFVFSMELRQIRYATSETVIVPADALGKPKPGAEPAQAKAQVQKTRDQATPAVNKGIGNKTDGGGLTGIVAGLTR